MSTYTIDKIEYGGDVYRLQDSVSDYITGIDYQDVIDALGYTPTDNVGTVTSMTLTQGTGISINSSGVAITNSGSRTISLATITKSDSTSTVSPAHGETFTAIDSITYDTYGRVTGVNTKTITLPADSNTDTLVTQTNTTNNLEYRLLFSANANDSDETDISRKNTYLRYNPNKKILVNGGEIRANKGVFNELVATTLKADSATITDLETTNATVVGLLDVRGEMHTNQWTNANIANVGGSFYVAPTVSSNNIMTITISTETVSGTIYYTMMVGAPNNSFVTDAVKIYDSTHDPATYNPGWPVGSRVMVTGNIRVGDDGIDYPLGTLTGYLTQALSGTGFTLGRIAQDSQLSTILTELGITNPTSTIFKSTNISISMYEIGSGAIDGILRPVGIMMTSYGVDKATYLDIYGGVNQKSSDSVTGQTDPNLRIGYLGGLPSFNVNNKTT